MRFRAEGEPLNVCHCRFCQKAHGAPFLARAAFDQRAVRLQGLVGRFPSSPALERLFCRRCGTRIGAWRVNGTVVGLALALFDDQTAFAPTEHVWVSAKLPWLTLADGLPQYAEGPPTPAMEKPAPPSNASLARCD